MATIYTTPGGPMSRRTRNTIIGCGTAVVIILFICFACSGLYLLVPWLQARVADLGVIANVQPTAIPQPQPTVVPSLPQPTVVPGPAAASQPTPVPQPTIVPQPTTIAPRPTAVPQTVSPAAINTNEPLKGTLDDFGRATRHADRFALAGTIMDESYNPGEVLVGNSFAIHDNGFVSQNGCVVFYYQAPSNGGRIRFIGYDGQFFEFDSGAITLNQAIAAMRTTLENAHGCKGKVQYHQLVRYGDAVK